MNRLRVLVVDDHEVVRKGLRALLESQREWEVCGEAVNGRKAIEKAIEYQRHVVVLDVCMPELGGLETTRQILKTVPGTEILVLTMHESEQAVQDVFQAGARGCLLKSDAGRELLMAVETLSQSPSAPSSVPGSRVCRRKTSSTGSGPRALAS